MSDTADATEIVAEAAEEVVDISRDLSGHSLGMVIGGFVIGAGLGGILGYIFCQRRIETKYSQIAADEIAVMREEYYQKSVARDVSSTKQRSPEDIVRERGYAPEPDSSRPPMAVTPPAEVVDAAHDDEEGFDEEDDVEGDPIDTEALPEEKNVFRDVPQEEDGWNHHKERARRSPLRPYVIHVDEREEHDAYDAVTYTYYEEDDVLCNDRDDAMSEEDREKVIGEANLEKFGHGSRDPTVVYIRNDQLEMDIEVCKSPNSYAREVHGLEPEIRHADQRRRERATFDDE